MLSGPLFDHVISTVFGLNLHENVVSAGAANAANGANNGKAAAIAPASPVVSPNSSPSSSVKTVALPPTCVVKVSLL